MTFTVALLQFLLTEVVYPEDVYSQETGHWSSSVPRLDLENVPRYDLLVQRTPKTHRHMKTGRHGQYRVFCLDDYKKMKREMRLASLVGADKDPETLQEKVLVRQFQ